MVFGTADDKWQAIVEEVLRRCTHRPAGPHRHALDRQIAKSFRGMLNERGIEHKVLNAHDVAAEAEIVAARRQPGKVTVATNMAGRGTDIRLGHGVAEAGRPARDLHRAARLGRIDRQLIGRCGRQGDPGTVAAIPVARRRNSYLTASAPSGR